MAKRTFQIYRYDPDKDAKPYMQTVEVELDGSERMLLDALKTVRRFPPALPVQRAAVLPARKNQHSARVHEQRRQMT